MGWMYGLALWPHPWPCPCSFKVKVLNNHIWGMGRLTDMERKGCGLIIHDRDSDLLVTMVGWVDVPDSDWGDFWRRCAINISSFVYAYLYTETKMSSFWRNFNHWLNWKLSFWQLPVQPVMKISSKRRHFRFSVQLGHDLTAVICQI